MVKVSDLLNYGNAFKELYRLYGEYTPTGQLSTFHKLDDYVRLRRDADLDYTDLLRLVDYYNRYSLHVREKRVFKDMYEAFLESLHKEKERFKIDGFKIFTATLENFTQLDAVIKEGEYRWMFFALETATYSPEHVLVKNETEAFSLRVKEETLYRIWQQIIDEVESQTNASTLLARVDVEITFYCKVLNPAEHNGAWSIIEYYLESIYN